MTPPSRGYRVITAPELCERLGVTGEAFLLLDVREPWEFQVTHIPGATLCPMMDVPERVSEFDREVETIVVCHYGLRSAHVADYLHGAGFTNLFNLEGGLDAYADVDAEILRY